MKETLNYYYNLSLIDVEKWDNYYTFKINNSLYYFTPLKRNPKELNDILLVIDELKKKNIPVHDLILNKFGNYITNIYNTNYVLLKPMDNIYEEYDLPVLLDLNRKLILTPQKRALYEFSWPKLWSDKIDYFEYQISEMGKGKNIILNSFSYYIGLAENAISYASNTTTKYKISENDRICLSHRRIKFPNYKLNFMNPLSFIFDLEVRDLSEYLKSAFFEGEDALSYLKLLLKKEPFTIYSLQLLYARLLYPSYYFDLYEEIMNNNLEEEKLIKIIEKSSSYEIFLKESFFEIQKYASIEPIDWIIKKEL